MEFIFWRRRKSSASATQNDFRRLVNHIGMSQSATPAARNEATRRLERPKVTIFAELTIGTAMWPSRERLTAAQRLANTPSTPQTPRVKREPLLRIREKCLSCLKISTYKMTSHFYVSQFCRPRFWQPVASMRQGNAPWRHGFYRVVSNLGIAVRFCEHFFAMYNYLDQPRCSPGHPKTVWSQ